MYSLLKKMITKLLNKALLKLGITIHKKQDFLHIVDQIINIIIYNKLSAFEATLLLAELANYIGRDLSQNTTETPLEIATRSKKDGAKLKVGEHLIILAEDIRNLAYTYE